jgi:hypothetical protein
VLDERRGRIEPVSGDYSDSALQYLSRASSSGIPIPKPCDTSQVPQVDGMDADFYSDFNTDLVYPVSCVATLVDNL